MIKTTIAILILAITIQAHASKKTYGTAKVSRIISVYDGDTFRADLSGYPDIVGKNISVRIYGIDTPEMRDDRPLVKELAQRAKWLVFNKLSNAKVIEIKDMKRGKYFRVVGVVYVDGKNLGKLLVGHGLAKPYFGGKKQEWEVVDNQIVN